MLLSHRDEFLARPTQGLHRWREGPILAGRDLRSGGTWLGFGRGGRWAILTNRPPREGEQFPATAPTRGQLVANFLLGELSPEEYLAGLRASEYAGFQLLLGRGPELFYVSDGESARRLPAGLYGLGNAPLGTPHRRTERALETFQEPNPGGCGGDWLEAFCRPELLLRAPDYGTRHSLVALGTGSKLEVWERNWDVSLKPNHFAMEPW